MNRLDIFTMMRDGMTAEEAIEKAFGELMTLIAELKAENKVNARNYQDSRSEAAEYREQWLKAEANTNALIAKNAYLDGVIEQRNAEIKRGRDDFMQALTDPENQPSQWGTVTLEMYEALERKSILQRSNLDRVHHLLKDHGWHPGRTDDDIIDVLNERIIELKNIQAEQPVREPLTDEQIEDIAIGIAADDYDHDLIRRLERYHGIGSEK